MKNTKYGFFSAFKDLFRFSKENRKRYIIGSVFMIAFVVTSMLYTTSYSNLIANIMSLNYERAIKLAIICGLLRTFSITYCHNQYRKIVICSGEEISATIQKKIYAKFLTLSMNSFEHMKSGKIFTTIKAADSGMMRTISSLLQESAYCCTSIVMLFIIFFIDYKIGIVVTIVSFLSLYLFKIQLDRSKKYLHDEFEYSDNYSTLITETTKGIREIKALDLKNKCYNLFQNDIDDLKEVRTARRLLDKNVNTTKWTIRIIGDTIVILYIINQLKFSIISIETAMLLITYMNNIIDDVFHRIIEHDFGISEFTANMLRIKSLLEDSKLEKEKFGKENYNDIIGNIEFKNIVFSYNNENDNVLNNVSFKIKNKEKNAIIGMSGCGKTTIFKLLLKQYDNYYGNILIDNHNIKDFSESCLRNTITIVNQEPMLFNMTIKNNLLMVNENATDEEIRHACKLANIDDFINTLPNKYDEIIEENTTNLSIGQKQRIAIARAILKNTPIILFDEITSALDKNSKRIIEKTINKLSEEKTIIVIAHTLDSIEDYDNIIVLKDGKITEQGSHSELMENKGLYFKMINL